MYSNHHVVGSCHLVDLDLQDEISWPLLRENEKAEERQGWEVVMAVEPLGEEWEMVEMDGDDVIVARAIDMTTEVNEFYHISLF